MGQPVGVVEHQSRSRGVIRYEANRNLTGMGHERFTSVAQAAGNRPAAVVARRLLETGQVAWVHVYGNVITVDLLKGHTADGLAEIITDLYTFYRPGVQVPSFDEVVPQDDQTTATATATAAEPEAALSEAAKKIPPHLLARSQAAKEKARAKAAEG